MVNIGNLLPITKEQFNQIGDLVLLKEWKHDGKSYSTPMTLCHRLSFVKAGRKVRFHLLQGHKPLTVQDYAEEVTKQLGLEEGKHFEIDTVKDAYSHTGEVTYLVFRGDW